MKTAISLPDEVFQEAEQVAHSLGLTRSQLYTRAVRAFVEANRQEYITRKLDEVYADPRQSELEAGYAALQFTSVSPNDW